MSAPLAWIGLSETRVPGGTLETLSFGSRLFFAVILITCFSKPICMSSLYTKKIRQNADLVNAISKCPFGEPVPDCPFIPYYEMKNERKQMEQIEIIPQEKLDEMRKFHRACMHELVKTRKANFL